MKINQKGFGVVGVLILLAVICLLGFVSYSFISTDRDRTLETTAPLPLPPLARGVAGPQVSALDKYLEVPGLNDALKGISENNPCAPTEGRFKQIILGVTADKTQALIGNSCGSTGVLRTFMIQNGNTWERVGDWKDEGSRTEFSALTDTPSCEIVDRYNIQASIAPVCFEKKAGSSDLFAGDITNYSYRSRL